MPVSLQTTGRIQMNICTFFPPAARHSKVLSLLSHKTERFYTWAVSCFIYSIIRYQVYKRHSLEPRIQVLFQSFEDSHQFDATRGNNKIILFNWDRLFKYLHISGAVPITARQLNSQRSPHIQWRLQPLPCISILWARFWHAKYHWVAPHSANSPTEVSWGATCHWI